MMVVATKTQPAFSAGKPQMLFRGQYVPTLTTMANYDVSADRQRLLMVKSDEEDPSDTQINCRPELVRRVEAPCAHKVVKDKQR